MKRFVSLTVAAAVAALTLTPAAAHADGPITTCADVISPRTTGPWAQSLDIPAGADVGWAGFAWDEHPAGAGDRDDQAQDERFSIAGELTPDVPDVNDRDEIAFDGGASPWPGGLFVIKHVTGSLAVQVKVCWTVYPPDPTVPDTTVPTPSTVVEPTVPPTSPAITSTTVVLPPPPLPDPAPVPDEVGPCRIVMECDDPRFDTPTTVAPTPDTVPTPTGDTLPRTGPVAELAAQLSVGVAFLLVGAFAGVASSRRRAARRLAARNAR